MKEKHKYCPLSPSINLTNGLHKYGIFFVPQSQKGSAKKMPPQKTQEIPGFFACLGAKKVHGSFIDAKPDFWPYVGPEVATAHFSPNFESDFRKYFKDFSAAAVSMRSRERLFYSDQGRPPSPPVLKFFLTAPGSVPPE